MIEEIKRSALGMAVIADWLGSGGQPVTPVIAERRSMACVTGNNGKPCPHNHGSQNGLNWWDWCKDKIAKTIRLHIGIKKRLKLKVTFEDQLQMCDICGCCLRTKIWTPTEHVRAHTTNEMRDQFPHWCWMKDEKA